MGKGKIESLKHDLKDKIFIGDFVGNSDLINLIKYPRETICFHSVVEKHRTKETAKDTAYCLPNSIASSNGTLLMSFQLVHAEFLRLTTLSATNFPKCTGKYQTQA